MRFSGIGDRSYTKKGPGRKPFTEKVNPAGRKIARAIAKKMLGVNAPQGIAGDAIRTIGRQKRATIAW